MPTVTAWLEAYYGDPQTGVTAYRLKADVGMRVWVTKITNYTIGDLWFPKFGQTIKTAADLSGAVKVASMASLGATDLMTIYDSPKPLLPLDIVAYINYAGSPWRDSGTDSSMDVHTRKPGLSPPYMEVILEYGFPAPVEFDAQIDVVEASPWASDGCSKRFQLVGGTMVLQPVLSNIVISGAETARQFKWHVKGATVVSGVVDSWTDATPIRLSLDRPGAVSVTLEATLTSQLGTGPNADVESGSRTTGYSVQVLTQQELVTAAMLCKLMQETLPIPHLVFPGDPARVGRPADLVALKERFERAATAFLRELDGTIAERARRT